MLFYLVFQHQTQPPLKHPCIIGNQNGTGGDGVSGNRRVVRADRYPDHTQRDPDVRGGVHRGAIPGQNASTSWMWRGEAFGPVAPKRISAQVMAETTMRWLRSTACSRRFSAVSGCSRMMNEQIQVSSIYRLCHVSHLWLRVYSHSRVSTIAG